MNSFKTLDQLTPGDRALVGGKAFNCGVLKQAGFPVPDGLAIPAGSSDDEVSHLAENRWMQALPAGVLLAVRSSGLTEDSAEHSFAGMHESQLNVTREQLVPAVRACRVSSGSAAAVAYRAARALDGGEVRIGVLVQRMVPSVVSGVAFTVNPLTGADECVINAAPGLGDDLVSGRVDPDEFHIDKRTAAVVYEHRGAAVRDTRETLSASQLHELALLLGHVESHYGAPQDVEWCYDGAQFWIVQSRPVTTTAAGRASTTYERYPDTEWTRANLAEVLPDLTAPQVVAVYENMLNVAQRRYLGRLLDEARLGPMFMSCRGRMYMNLSQMRRILAVLRAPAAGMLKSLGHPEAIRPDDAVAQPAPISETLRCVPDLLRIAMYDLRAGTLFRAHEQRTRDLVARLAALTADTMSAMSDRQIFDVIADWVARAPDAIQVVFVMTGVLPRETMLRKAAETARMPYERLVYPQLGTGARSVSSQQAFDLVALTSVARQDDRVSGYLRATDGSFKDFREQLAGTAFLAAFERFLDTYGHRGRYESDWSIPRLHEDPVPALFAIRVHLQSPSERVVTREQQDADARAAWTEFESRLSAWQRLTLAPRVRRTLDELKQQYLWREEVRSNLTRVLRYVRRLHLTLADRFVARGWIAARGDYFLLTLDEVRRAIDDSNASANLATVARTRRSALNAARDMKMPLLTTGRELVRFLAEPRSAVTAQAAEGGTGDLEGLCVSPGCVEADVVVMHDPGEFASMRRGAILVAPATDPSWTPLFTLAAGVVVEVGGMLSHASTIAREYGLPALANVKDATKILKTGERVTLDASGGRVRRLTTTPE